MKTEHKDYAPRKTTTRNTLWHFAIGLFVTVSIFLVGYYTGRTELRREQINQSLLEIQQHQTHIQEMLDALRRQREGPNGV